MKKNILALTLISSCQLLYTSDKNIEDLSLEKLTLNATPSYSERFFTGDLTQEEALKIDSAKILSYIYDHLYENGVPCKGEYTLIMNKLKELGGIELMKEKRSGKSFFFKNFDYILSYQIINEDIVQDKLKEYYGCMVENKVNGW